MRLLLKDVEHRLEDIVHLLGILASGQSNRLTDFKLQDLAQYIQEEMYHFVLGPDMMERIRRISNVSN